ncbi:MAG: anaerobic ribonucleoside-triphosphate reductase activating protein [Acetobacteraceae bacterium]|nr:anaerobic ribonucleoside-triphosphate reductase activating protein [Acetobacteraceae bacterium]
MTGIPATDLRIGGLARLSSSDWPGELVATVFCQGCGWRCRYCHNPHLQPAVSSDLIAWPAVMAFLRQRRGLLDGVVFSGGEPTLQSALAAAMQEVRGLGFRIGLHTGGAYPDRLAAVLPLVDWVGFDAKMPFSRYEAVTGVDGSGERARESLLRLLASGKACEVRTTVHPWLLDQPALEALADELATLGVTHYVVQAFRSIGCRDEELNRMPSATAPLLPAHLQMRFAEFLTR